MRWSFLLALSLLASPDRAVFTNPLLQSGADPWVISHGGDYFYMQTTGRNLTIWETPNPARLATAKKKVVWQPPATGPYSHDIWAPELHFLSGKWYIYFAADDGKNETHRIWALENAAANPLEGEWVMKGKVSDSTDHWAIDASVFQNRGQTYMVWSGWPGEQNGEQDIYIARMSNPWTIEGPRVRLSSPSYPWEKNGTSAGPKVEVNEGPEVLIHGSDVFLTYSASGCWTDGYKLGMLRASVNADLMKPASWKKLKDPVFTSSPEGHAFGAGHNGFFKSPDGKEDWIVYHANPEAHEGCGANRSPRAQPFTWGSDGLPHFGKPAPLGTPLPVPSGAK